MGITDPCSECVFYNDGSCPDFDECVDRLEYEQETQEAAIDADKTNLS